MRRKKKTPPLPGQPALPLDWSPKDEKPVTKTENGPVRMRPPGWWCREGPDDEEEYDDEEDD